MVYNRAPNQTKRCSSSKERATAVTAARNDIKAAQNNRNLPRKSAYYGNKTNADATINDGKEGGENRAKSPVKYKENDSQKKKPNSTSPDKSPATVKDSIFKAPARNHVEIAEDVIRADCMNHGYRIEKTVGEGAYAKVKLAEVLPSKLARNEKLAELARDCTNETLFVAIKVIESKNVPKEFLKKFLPRELGNHCPLPPHKNVVEVYEQFKTTDRYYVVMEYCSRGDLLDLINQKISESSKGVGEDRARSLFKMMAEGVHHIHSNGIVHRDLKCENILLNHENNIKITDFGFSTKFTPDKTALLKTSCGSYAYTAPEVIRMKQYDGTKSDAWSLGIILFAMLNGRLPFNDAQLSELEEDMKMQRLRFERTVSFESMVLVRRILQYNPTSRPNTAEILNDPWLTGKRLIPRQINKPKWVNPYQKIDDEEEGGAKAGNPVYYKVTVPERGPEATVTVNHEKNETVVLKSRTGNKKNIWTSGPPVSNRPNTWPQQDKKKQAEKERASRDHRYRKTKATVVVKQHEGQKKGQCHTSKDDNCSKKDYTGTEKFTKWFMEKYMTARDATTKDHTKGSSNNCGCCKAEAALAKMDPKPNNDELEPELLFFDDNNDVINDVDDFRFPSPVKNVGDAVFDEIQNTNKVNVNDAAQKVKVDEKGQKAKVDEKSGKVTKASAEPTKQPRSTSSRSGKTSACSTRRPSPTVRQSTIKSSSVTHGPSAIKKTGYTSPTMSKSVDLPRRNALHYLVNRSTSPAERVKYFRDRLMKLYGNEKIDPDNLSGLPPLMVQALKPPKSSSESRDAPGSAPPGTGRKRMISAKSGKTRCKSSTIKPVQRVIVH